MDWEIKSRSHTCSRTGRSFKEGEVFYTLLFRDKEGFRREDVSVEAWEQRNDNIQPFSFWRSKYEAPAPRPAEPLKKDDAEGLLRQLIGENRPEHVNARYILALMLERKRVLRPVESGDDDLLVYEHIKTGEVITLQNPHLGLDMIPYVQQEVAELFQIRSADLPAEASAKAEVSAITQAATSPECAANDDSQPDLQAEPASVQPPQSDPS